MEIGSVDRGWKTVALKEWKELPSCITGKHPHPQNYEH